MAGADTCLGQDLSFWLLATLDLAATVALVVAVQTISLRPGPHLGQIWCFQTDLLEDFPIGLNPS